MRHQGVIFQIDDRARSEIGISLDVGGEKNRRKHKRYGRSNTQYNQHYRFKMSGNKGFSRFDFFISHNSDSRVFMI